MSQYAEDYAQALFEPYQVKYRQKKLFERLALYPHRRILEVGCAMDPLYHHVSDCEQLVIVEPADVFYRAAVEGSGDKPYVKCVHGFLEDALPELKKYSYDFIVLSGLIQEVENPKKFLEAVCELCDSNTIVHINVPNAFSFHRLLAVEMGLIDSVYQKSATQVRMQQQITFDLDCLSALVQSTGFKILNQGSYFIKPFTHSQMSKLMEAGLVTDRMLDGFYGMERHMPGLGSEIFVDVQKCV